MLRPPALHPRALLLVTAALAGGCGRTPSADVVDAAADPVGDACVPEGPFACELYEGALALPGLPYDRVWLASYGGFSSGWQVTLATGDGSCGPRAQGERSAIPDERGLTSYEGEFEMTLTDSASGETFAALLRVDSNHDPDSLRGSVDGELRIERPTGPLVVPLVGAPVCHRSGGP